MASKYIFKRFLKSYSFYVENGYAVRSGHVKAFMKVLSDLFNILKKGSLTG